VSSLARNRFGQHILRYILFPRWHGWVCSTLVVIHFVGLLAWDGFGEHMLRYILCPRLHMIGLVKMC
jgi:hypothetical protein